MRRTGRIGAMSGSTRLRHNQTANPLRARQRPIARSIGPERCSSRGTGPTPRGGSQRGLRLPGCAARSRRWRPMGCLAGGYRDLRASYAPRPAGTQAGQEVAVTTDKSGRISRHPALAPLDDRLEVLLAHMGGPYWVNKDLGHWTIPKGEIEEGEEPVAVARREFAEETGHELPDTPLIELGEIGRSRGSSSWRGRRGDLDATTAVSNTYQMEWPPRSGVSRPSRDRPRRMVQAQAGSSQAEGGAGSILDRLQAALAADR